MLLRDRYQLKFSDRALALIRPEDEEQCRKELAEAIRVLRAQMRHSWQPAGEQQRNIREAADALRKASVALGQVPSIFYAGRDGTWWQELHDHIAEAGRELAREATDARVPERSGGRHDPLAHVKEWSALYAYDLLVWNGRKPTLTAGGPYFQLANLLFQVVTRRRDVDLGRYCRKYFKNA